VEGIGDAEDNADAHQRLPVAGVLRFINCNRMPGVEREPPAGFQCVYFTGGFHEKIFKMFTFLDAAIILMVRI
jgi:hypothetical protein